MKKRPLKLVWNKARNLWEPAILEEHVLTEIVDRLWIQANIKMWRIRERIPGKGFLSTPGLPDIVGWIKAKKITPPEGAILNYHMLPWPKAIPLFIEVKRPGGARRAAQIRFIDEAKADGCVAFFAESWADVVRELAKVGINLTEGT